MCKLIKLFVITILTLSCTTVFAKGVSYIFYNCTGCKVTLVSFSIPASKKKCRAQHYIGMPLAPNMSGGFSVPSLPDYCSVGEIFLTASWCDPSGKNGKKATHVLTCPAPIGGRSQDYNILWKDNNAYCERRSQ